jgi:hypothetical protein
MGLDPEEGFAESDKVGDVQNRVWHELVKLHAVNEEKPTEKFVGRKRKTTQKKSEEHHPIAARGLGDALGAGEDDLIPFDEESFFLSLGQSACSNFNGTQLIAAFTPFFFAIWSLCATLFTGICKELRSGAARKLRSAREMQQWWWRKNKELVNSKNHSLPLIKLPVKGTWAETWRKNRKR